MKIEKKETFTPPLFHQGDKNHIQKCYIVDAARHGVRFANSHYSSYDCWEEGWEYDFDDEIKRQKETYEKCGKTAKTLKVRDTATR